LGKKINKFLRKAKNKKVDQKIQRGKTATKCVPNKKPRNHTCAYYGSKVIKRYYFIRPEDTLAKISRRVDLDIATLLILNKLKSQYNFKNSQIKTLLLSDCPLSMKNS